MRENEYKEILSALLGLLNEGVHIVAGQGTSIFYNSVMARMEQMEPADVVGRRFEDAFSHMDLESSTIYRALQAGHPPSISRSGTSTPAANIFTPLILPFRSKMPTGSYSP